jgi:DUF971 family protein
MNAACPTKVNLHKKSAILELTYKDDSQLSFSAEFLRVHSPSAEVRGHGKGQETLQTGKRHVKLINIEPVGNYGIKLVFDDGHDTGIFSWSYLEELGHNKNQFWDIYLVKLEAAGGTRDSLPDGAQILKIKSQT